eukprot:366214-Chlamydomonas_euryale.AAC.1
MVWQKGVLHARADVMDVCKEAPHVLKSTSARVHTRSCAAVLRPPACVRPEHTPTCVPPSAFRASARRSMFAQAHVQRALVALAAATASRAPVLQVYCIGEAGMTEEMRIAGVKALGGPSHADKKIDTSGPMVVDKDVSTFSVQGVAT